eukprot:CAMPEP_0178824774 /NCGR_PEP_ID=MMETSP0746-20121128/5858_1 /TAXON_ID=913974 /ORGANISM="Nitzschia punctata, Strain CCMP561" /LENGTH=265 /DNA_ID=CAMNT_0020486475 /DNA_START=583 /DNA_END=1380 /DNA_ORIENTATION=-
MHTIPNNSNHGTSFASPSSSFWITATRNSNNNNNFSSTNHSKRSFQDIYHQQHCHHHHDDEEEEAELDTNFIMFTPKPYCRSPTTPTTKTTSQKSCDDTQDLEQRDTSSPSPAKKLKKDTELLSPPPLQRNYNREQEGSIMFHHSDPTLSFPSLCSDMEAAEKDDQTVGRSTASTARRTAWMRPCRQARPSSLSHANSPPRRRFRLQRRTKSEPLAAMATTTNIPLPLLPPLSFLFRPIGQNEEEQLQQQNEEEEEDRQDQSMND